MTTSLKFFCVRICHFPPQWSKMWQTESLIRHKILSKSKNQSKHRDSLRLRMWLSDFSLVLGILHLCFTRQLKICTDDCKLSPQKMQNLPLSWSCKTPELIENIFITDFSKWWIEWRMHTTQCHKRTNEMQQRWKRTNNTNNKTVHSGIRLATWITYACSIHQHSHHQHLSA